MSSVEDGTSVEFTNDEEQNGTISYLKNTFYMRYKKLKTSDTNEKTTSPTPLTDCISTP